MYKKKDIKVKPIYLFGATGLLGTNIVMELQKQGHSVNILNSRDLDLSLIKTDAIVILATPPNVSNQLIISLKQHQYENKVVLTVIDCSSAKRMNSFWFYYMISNQNLLSQKIAHNQRNAQLITHPGCFASGMHYILEPIISYLTDEPHLNFVGLSGYSAGGTDYINEHTKLVALNNVHSHLEEIKYYYMLKDTVLFTPIVIDEARGQMVSLKLAKSQLKLGQSLVSAYNEYYSGINHLIKVNIINNTDKLNSLTVNQFAYKEDVSIYCYEHEAYYEIVVGYDNIFVCVKPISQLISKLM